MSRRSHGSPPFRSMVRSGPGETWTHNTDARKFDEFGWRANTKESNFENETLIGNWNEERFDIEKMSKAKPLSSQYGHYFETTSQASYPSGHRNVPEAIKNLEERDVYAYPGHQPELDNPCLKRDYRSWATTSRVSYIDPNIRRHTLQPANEKTQ